MPYAVRMSILSSLAMGHALHANGDATVTYQAVMATFTQVMRIGQVALVVALFVGVVRLFLAFLRKATTLPCSHGFADLTECLDCSHPDWFDEVEASRLAPAPVIVPSLVEPELERSDNSGFAICPECDGYGGSSAYLGDFTVTEMYEVGEDFVQDYFAGNYDRACPTCKGHRVVKACSVRMCLSPRVTATSPWGHGSDELTSCYEHLTPDEDETLRDNQNAWGEFRSGC
jgi:hypothetical protein